MEENFKKIYNELKKENNDKYKSVISEKTTKLLFYLFVTWIITSFIQSMVRLIFTNESIIYLCMRMISITIMSIMLIMIIYIMNKNVSYWKIAYEFKSNVGTKFWNLLEKNLKYNPDRELIDKEFVKNEMKNLITKDFTIVDIEDSLENNILSMYTVKYDDENKKRFNGIFAIIKKNNSQINENIYNDIKNRNLSISKDLVKAKDSAEKIYLLIDAIEIFRFSNKDFFSEKELYEDYKRYLELKEL